MDLKYEVAIIGAGISGAALAYELARYTDINSICVLEKYEDIATLNSSEKANSQTIHFGDIETNYTFEKAVLTKQAAKMVEKYCLQYQLENNVIFSHQKMALGIGEKEVEFLLERYEEFKILFPNLQVWSKDDLKKIEPKLVYDNNGEDRKETIVGVGSINEWTTVNYKKMSVHLLENAKKQENTVVDIFTNSEALHIIKEDQSFKINTKEKSITARFVVVNAGAHSLYLAHKMGFGHEYSCLPIAGSFYMTKEKFLNGKVYMVQNPKLPFAALHGDPDIAHESYTRFGPTALVLPKLERYKKGTYKDFWTTLRFDKTILSIFYNLLKEGDIRNYIARNIFFEIPFISKILFIKDVRKIIPSLKMSEIQYAHNFGGVRPQVLDKKKQKLMLGEASINTGEGIIFNMTPSPGATSCLANAKRDLLQIVSFLNKNFDDKKFEEELIEKETRLENLENQSAQKEYISKIRQEIKDYEEKYYYSSSSYNNELPSYWEKPYNPWRNKRDHWSF